MRELIKKITVKAREGLEHLKLRGVQRAIRRDSTDLLAVHRPFLDAVRREIRNLYGAWKANTLPEEGKTQAHRFLDRLTTLIGRERTRTNYAYLCYIANVGLERVLWSNELRDISLIRNIEERRSSLLDSAFQQALWLDEEQRGLYDEGKLIFGSLEPSLQNTLVQKVRTLLEKSPESGYDEMWLASMISYDLYYFDIGLGPRTDEHAEGKRKALGAYLARENTHVD